MAFGAAQGGTAAVTLATFRPDRYSYAGSLSGFLNPSDTATNGAISADAAIGKAGEAFHAFMMAQTREANLVMFTDMAGGGTFKSGAEVPFSILLPAFVTSELKTAFQIGFMIFIPFLVIDMVVASVLMSLGMMMLSPVLVALPFKLMLFVLADGWNLLIGSLAASFAQ